MTLKLIDLLHNKVKLHFISSVSVLVILLLFFSCKKDIGYENQADNNNGSHKIPNPSPVSGTVAGWIIDENSLPLENAQVTVANNIYITDANGFFKTNSLILDKYLTTVMVSKQGYFKGYRNFCANATINHVKIKLIPKQLSNSFNSSEASLITLSNGTKLSFLANSIVIKSSNAVYNGTVNVYAKYIDPTASDIRTIVPGGFVGIDSSNIYALKSKGMIVVELESPSGEPLQLAVNKPATLKMPIPVNLIYASPASIATWSLNEKGIWKKEGMATKNGNAYDFQVTHFSFWNLDEPIDPIYLTINVKDPNGQNVIGADVSLQSSQASGYGTAYGITDSLGNVSGFVPKNEIFTLEVQYASMSCGAPLYTQQIGPFNTDANLNIAATIPPSQMLTVKGIALNCAGTPATTGFVYIHKDNDSNHTVIADVVNGNFSINIPHCSPVSQITIKTYAGVIPQQPQIITYNVNSNLLDVGNITLCDSAYLGYVKYKIDTTNYVHVEQRSITSFKAFASQSGSITLFADNGLYIPYQRIYMNPTVLGASVGTFGYDMNHSLLVEDFTSGNVVSNNASITFDTFGNIGEYISGSFNIPFTDNLGVLHSFIGTFKMRRQ